MIRFRASFGSTEILDALLSVSKGKGKVWSVRLWETETINSLGWPENKWIRLGLQERSRKVCAHKLGEWLSILETEREMAKRRSK